MSEPDKIRPLQFAVEDLVKSLNDSYSNPDWHELQQSHKKNFSDISKKFDKATEQHSKALLKSQPLLENDEHHDSLQTILRTEKDTKELRNAALITFFSKLAKKGYESYFLKEKNGQSKGVRHFQEIASMFQIYPNTPRDKQEERFNEMVSALKIGNEITILRFRDFVANMVPGFPPNPEQKNPTPDPARGPRNPKTG